MRLIKDTEYQDVQLLRVKWKLHCGCHRIYNTTACCNWRLVTIEDHLVVHLNIDNLWSDLGRNPNSFNVVRSDVFTSVQGNEFLYLTLVPSPPTDK